jgi:hypothetical protein
LICDARLIDASVPSGSCRMGRCDQVALLDGVRDPTAAGTPHSYFANAVSHGLCAVGKGAHNSKALAEAWLYRLFSLVLFEPLH